jgi:flagellar biogenesis protein FliO
MGLLQWRWLMLGVIAAVLCAPLCCQAPLASIFGAAAYAKDAVKKKDPPTVEDTKVDAKDEGELALIDLGAGAQEDTGAEDLENGVTATGNAKAKDKAKNTATGQHPVAFLPFEDTRFLLNDRPENILFSGKADKARKSQAKKPALKSAKQPAAAAGGAKAVKKPAVKRPPSKKFIESIGLAGPAPADAAAGAGYLKVGPELPAGRDAAGSADASGPTLDKYFSADELAASGSDSTELSAAGQLSTETAIDTSSDLYTGVIHTRGGVAAPAQAAKPLNEALRDAKSSGIGTNLAAVSPWRAVTMVLMTLALLFAGAWAAGKFKGLLPGGTKRNLAVIESITIAPGRQITIVEMHGDALVLGITPQSINLLDKLPLERFSDDYSSTVRTIINREASALPTEWAKQPAFVAGTSVPKLTAPPQRAYVPPPRERISVGELRRARSIAGSAGSYPPARPVAYNSRGVPYANQAPVGVAAGRASKDELIDRLRSQLRNLED